MDHTWVTEDEPKHVMGKTVELRQFFEVPKL